MQTQILRSPSWSTMNRNYENIHTSSVHSLPSDPRCWSREDVMVWVRHMQDVHNLPPVSSDRFHMNGKALCLMNVDMFVQRVPLGGKLLYKDFQIRLTQALYQSVRNNNSC